MAQGQAVALSVEGHRGTEGHKGVEGTGARDLQEHGVAMGARSGCCCARACPASAAPTVPAGVSQRAAGRRCVQQAVDAVDAGAAAAQRAPALVVDVQAVLAAALEHAHKVGEYQALRQRRSERRWAPSVHWVPCIAGMPWWHMSAGRQPFTAHTGTSSSRQHRLLSEPRPASMQ